MYISELENFADQYFANERRFWFFSRTICLRFWPKTAKSAKFNYHEN